MRNKLKKTLIVTSALIIGFLMPYLSRIPLAFTYGMEWIWKYMPDFDAFKWWNYLHCFSLVPIVVAGFIFIYGNVRWAFYAAAIAHFVATFLFYYNFEEQYQRDDFLGFIIFPFLIGGPSFLCGLAALIVELVLNRRKAQLRTRVENEQVY